MQILINIPEEEYELIIGDEACGLNTLTRAVARGTVLPKGHGRLIDEERISLSGIHFETERDHAMMIGRLNSASTVIEADKEKNNADSRTQDLS